MPPEPVGPEGYFSLLNQFYILGPIVLALIVILAWIIQKNRSNRTETPVVENEKAYQSGRIYTALDQKTMTIPILLGGLLVLPLPVISVVARSSCAAMGWIQIFQESIFFSRYSS